MIKCPKCKKPLKNELEMGLEPIIGYAVESGLRAAIGSGRATYWACTNPECGCCFDAAKNRFWFKLNEFGKPVPKNFLARELGLYPRPKKKKRG